MLENYLQKWYKGASSKEGWKINMYDYFLGIEWSSHQLAIVCLKKTGKNNFRQLKADRLSISQETFQSPAKVFQNWVELNLPHNAKAAAVLSVPESLVFIKELELPVTKDKELPEAISWEISSSDFGSPSDNIIQWKKIATSEKTTKIAAFIIKKQQAKNLLSVFKNSPVKLIAIEPSSLSLLRTLEINQNKETLFVNVGKRETNFIIIKDGVPVFSSTAAIQISPSKNQKRKLDSAVKNTLTSGAKQALLYWESKEKKKIQQIILFGEGLKYSGLAKAINQFAHIPTTIARNKKINNLFLVPLGAALRLKNPDYLEEVNFLPEEERLLVKKEKNALELTKKILVFSIVNFAILASLLGFLFFLRFRSALLAREIDQTKLFVQNHPAQKAVTEINTANDLLNKLQLLAANQDDVGEKLRQISLLTPANIRFTSLKISNMTEEQWEIQGVADRIDILAFYDKLKGNNKTVTMPFSNLNKEKESLFKMVILW